MYLRSYFVRHQRAILRKHSADLGDERADVRFLHERRWPYPLLHLDFGDCAIAVRKKQVQQFERLRRQVNLVAVSKELPRIAIQRKGAEAIDHTLRSTERACVSLERACVSLR
jgi:hypothetical protein